MNLFGGFGTCGHGTNNCCSIIWLLFLLQICGCGNGMFGGDNDCMNLIFLLLILSCCGCGCNTPCGNN